MRSRASSGTPASASGRDRCSCTRERGRAGGVGLAPRAKGGQGFLWPCSPCSARSCRTSQPWSRRRRASGRRTFHRRTLPAPTSHTRAHSCPALAHRPQPAGSRETSSPGCPQPPATAPEPKRSRAGLGPAPPNSGSSPPSNHAPSALALPLLCSNQAPPLHTLRRRSPPANPSRSGPHLSLCASAPPPHSALLVPPLHLTHSPLAAGVPEAAHHAPFHLPST